MRHPCRTDSKVPNRKKSLAGLKIGKDVYRNQKKRAARKSGHVRARKIRERTKKRKKEYDETIQKSALESEG